LKCSMSAPCTTARLRSTVLLNPGRSRSWMRKSKREKMLNFGSGLREVDVCGPPGLASNLLVLVGILPLTKAWPTSCTPEMLKSQVSTHSTSSTRVDSAGVRHLDCRWSRAVRQRRCTEGIDTGLLWMLGLVCVCPGARFDCVFELLFVPILDLDLSRGCAADLGTSRWRNLVAGCDLECQTAKCGRDASSIRSCGAQPRSRSGTGVVVDLELRCWWLPT
jgi:hypothetical protein